MFNAQYVHRILWSLNLLLVVILFNIYALKSMALESDLNQAYQREYIYLMNQRKDLESAKRKTVSELKKHLSELEESVEAKSYELGRLETQVLEKNQELDGYKETIQKQENEQKKIDSLLLQSQETLKAFKINDDKEGAFSISSLLEEGAWALTQIDGVSIKKSDYFTEDGTKESGEIYNLGLVSSFIQNDKSTFLLAPAGEGALKVAKKTEHLQFSEQKPVAHELFLYDSLSVPYEQKAEKTFSGVLKAGGLIGYVIILFGFFGLFVSFKRFFNLKKYDFSDDEKNKFIKDLQGHKSFEATSVSIQKLNEAYAHDKENQTIFENALGTIERKVNRFGPVLLGIAAVAPLLGLLGTVTGMIATFDIITDVGTGNPKMLSGGISEALVTTQFGLVVAIPCLLVGNWLNAWAKRITFNLYEIQDSLDGGEEQ